MTTPIKSTSRIKAFFPSLNKNNTLDEYKELWEGDWNQVQIDKTLYLNQKQWDEFTTNLLQDDDRIAGMGGNGSDAKLREVDNFFEYSEAEREEYRKHSSV